MILAVADAGPIIHLDEIDALALLSVVDELLIPTDESCQPRGAVVPGLGGAVLSIGIGSGFTGTGVTMVDGRGWIAIVAIVPSSLLLELYLVTEYAASIVSYEQREPSELTITNDSDQQGESRGVQIGGIHIGPIEYRFLKLAIYAVIGKRATFDGPHWAFLRSVGSPS